MIDSTVTVADSAMVNAFVAIGKHSKIWHYCNVYGTDDEWVRIGENTVLGSYSEVKPNVRIGSACRLQSFVFIPEGVTIGDFVFIGPRVTFTNDKFPRAQKAINGTWVLEHTQIESHVSIGASSVICPGIQIGKGAFIGAGTVVTKDVPEYAMLVANHRIIGDVREERYKHKLPVDS